MADAATSLQARVFGVQWIRLDHHGFWVAPRTGAATPYWLSEIRYAEAYIEHDALRRRKPPGHYDRRLTDGMVYTAIGIIAGSVLLGPIGLLAALAAGILLVRRDAKGVLAIDLHLVGNTTETIRIWDVSEPLLSVAAELQQVTGGPASIGTR